MNERNPYLVTKALKTFMWGSILASVSAQIATTTDAIVVSNLIGPDAISAINLVMPVLAVFNCLMILFGIGSSILAAKAIGRRDEKSANGIFTSGILTSALTGIIFAGIIYLISPSLIETLTHGDSQIYGYALSYLQVMCVVLPFLMMAGVIENFVKTDGNPRIVMFAVLAGSLLNLILDIIFVKVLNMGIAGSAWATGLNYLLALLICLIHFRNPHCSLKWSLEIKKMKTFVGESVAQGLPMSINTLLLGACVYFINNIVMKAEGADGIYCWSVCLQLFMIMQMVLSGIGSSIYAIGGILVGEQDMKGLGILNRKCIIYAGFALAIVTAFILSFPEMFGHLFGSRSDNPVKILPIALRLFSLLLVPYSIVALLRATYQILGHTYLSLFLSVIQLLIMVGFVWVFSFINPVALWWGFPASAFILMGLLILYTLIVHYRHPDIKAITLMPEIEDAPSLNISVKMNREGVIQADKEISDFLQQKNLDSLTVYGVRVSCEELMNNIVNYAVDKRPEKHFFDLHIRINTNEVNVLLKDDGRPFNPVLSDDEKKVMSVDNTEKLGLKLVNNTTGDINYKYMYDQNMVQIKFPINNKNHIS